MKLSASLRHNYSFYIRHHRTKGCRITHMVGVPIIVTSCLLMLMTGGRRKIGFGLFAFGWFLQFLGHFQYEHNQPVFLELRSPLTAVSALLFVWKLWVRVFARGRL